jgi:hypothetical protein
MLAVAVVGLAAATAIPQGQPAPKRPVKVPKSGTMTMWCQVGSFALEGEGRVEITFTGTLLVSQHDGPPVQVSGRVRKEYEGMGREAWFGTGKAVVQGKWRKVQWFGKNMNAKWVGRGLAMVFGEYDAKEQTGFTKVDDLPAYPWLTTGRPFYVPKEMAPGYDPNAKPAKGDTLLKPPKARQGGG